MKKWEKQIIKLTLMISPSNRRIEKISASTFIFSIWSRLITPVSAIFSLVLAFTLKFESFFKIAFKALIYSGCYPIYLYECYPPTWWDGLPGLVIPLGYAVVSFNLAERAKLEKVLTKTSHFQVAVLA